MAVRAIGTYDFPSRSREELYGGDRLLHVWWRNNPWFAAAACFRVPSELPWQEFLTGMVHPLFSCDPDFDPAATVFSWSLDGQPFDPQPHRGLADLGAGHKSLLACRSTTAPSS